LKTFKTNHKFASTYNGSVKELTEKKLKELIHDQQVHVVVGGPPCQGFSTVGLGDPNWSTQFTLSRIRKISEINFPVLHSYWECDGTIS